MTTTNNEKPVWFISGCSTGFGRELASHVLKLGYRTVITARDPDDVKDLAELGDALVLKLDVTDHVQAEAAIKAAEDAFGHIDVLVNNAGIQHVARVEDFPPEKWDAILAINLSSAFHATRLAIPAMRAADGGKGWGRIINIASVHGLVASAEKAAYVAAKHGLVGLTKVTALETATTGITCNAICPGWVLTPLVQKQVDAKAAAQGISNEEATRQLLGEKEPSMQFTTPEELGDLAVFFCSAAGQNIRGVAWNMDGGWAAQ
jgi:3-hydroxybutyrate dehydrogenase